MAKRRSHEEPWVQTVTIFSIIGLVALVATLVYLYIARTNDGRSGTYSSYSDKRNFDKKDTLFQYNALQRRWIKPLAPTLLQALETRVEVPLEIIRNNPKYQRPKVQQSFLRERIDRLENNVTLLKQTQQQEQALDYLNERIKRLQEMNILYLGEKTYEK